MPANELNVNETRPSFLVRLKSGDNAESWKEFYRTYGKVVRDFAIQAGLTDTEADEVVQETAIAMARHLPEFRYNPKVCRFKTFLLNQASWRIKDQINKRKKHGAVDDDSSRPVSSDETTRTSTINRIADPLAVDLDALFEGEWRKYTFELAWERMKEKFTLKQIQIFDLLVLKEWPAADVAKSFDLTLTNVYVTRHRISKALEKEIKLLERQFEKAAAQSQSDRLSQRGEHAQ
jgi:RNA polymerase sigma factor (sigma-70 family)